MNEGDVRRRRPEPRLEPTLGGSAAPAPESRFAPQSSRRIPVSAGTILLDGYEVDLAEDESVIDDAEVLDTNGLNRVLLTDRRLIIRGRSHQAVYPLRSISRVALLKYIRWWMVLLGVALGALAVAGAAVPVVMFKSVHPWLMLAWIGVFVGGVATAATALLRPVFYVEIKSAGGDMRLRLTKDYEALAGFLNSLMQRIA